MKLQTIQHRVQFYLKKGGLLPAAARRLFENNLQFLVNTPLYNKVYAARVSHKARSTIYPDHMNIETVNLCNAHCVFCHRNSLTRRKGIMSKEIFEKIINRVVDEKVPIKGICINGYGEPLLDPHLFDRIRFIKKKTALPVMFFTNGQLLDEKNARKAIESGVDEINLSFNAMFKEDYEAVMKISYDVTVENIKNFLRLRGSAKKPKLYLSCVYSKKYKFDKKVFLARWKPVMDSVFVMPAEAFGELKKEEAYPVSEYGYRVRQWPCFRLWKNIWVSIDGEVYLCCKDYNGQFRMGNLAKEPFLKVWKSGKFEAMRKMHLEGRYSSLPMCKDCEVLVRSSTGWWF